MNIIAAETSVNGDLAVGRFTVLGGDIQREILVTVNLRAVAESLTERAINGRGMTATTANGAVCVSAGVPRFRNVDGTTRAL